ncbi:ribonuclease H-like domain-containing protein [Tanacetum coccineum]
MYGEEPATQIAPVESPQMVSTVKLLILKKVILNGDGPIQVTTNENGVETEVPPKTAQALLYKQRERKAKSILLLAIPDEYQLSLLEVHGAVVSNEDANQKFLRALPSSWNNVTLIMRNKAGIDDLDIDDLYNNLKVFKADIKGSSGSSLNSQNVTFLSIEDTSSSNESIRPQPDDRRLEQIDHDDLEDGTLNSRCHAFIEEGAHFARTGYDWSYIAQDEPTEFALMAYTANSSRSDIELGLESVGEQLIVHQKNEAVYEEKIAVLEFEVKDKRVSAAKQSSFRAAASTGAVKQVNTATHTNRVNVSKTRTNTFHKSHLPIRRPFHKSTAPNTSISNEIVNTVRVKGANTVGQTTVSVVMGKGVTAVKASAGCVWRPKMTNLNNVSKDNSGSWVSKRVNYIDPQGRLKHMTGNKDFLTDYQDIDGGFVAFGGGTRGGKIIVLLRVPRQSNMYSFDLRNVVPSGDLTCLFANATIDESKLWHRRMGHVNFKTMNKLVKGNLVRGLPSKIFVNDHTCVACQKGKQHKASCKTKLVSSISQPLQMLHMDLFGPTSVRSINHKTYCLVVTDDFSREMNEFCRLKGIKREFSVARTPQQNGVAERKNMTLIEAARTMLADSLLPTVFWAEAVNTCSE